MLFFGHYIIPQMEVYYYIL